MKGLHNWWIVFYQKIKKMIDEWIVTFIPFQLRNTYTISEKTLLKGKLSLQQTQYYGREDHEASIQTSYKARVCNRLIQ